MSGRIEPTPEDLAIAARGVRRLVRWMHTANKVRPGGIDTAEAVRIARNAVGDGLHFADA